MGVVEGKGVNSSEESRILIGNSFPMGKIQRDVSIMVRSLKELKERIADASVHSFWGHTNTLNFASGIVGRSLQPLSERPAIILSESKYPMLNGFEFEECWILSPIYRDGFRPDIGAEIPLEEIIDWQVLSICWL
jgi:hypothetical protein